MKEILNEELFEGFGMIAYAVAKADGKVQPHEKREFFDIMERFYKKISPNFLSSQISFYLNKEYDEDLNYAYETGLNKLKKSIKDITPELVQMFKDTLLEIAKAFPPVVPEEKEILQRFDKDIQDILNAKK